MLLDPDSEIGYKGKLESAVAISVQRVSFGAYITEVNVKDK